MLRVTCPRGYEPERLYAVEVLLCDFLGLEAVLELENRNDVEITLGAVTPRLILADVLFQVPEKDWLTTAALPARPLPLWDLAATPIDATVVSPLLPIIYGRNLPDGSFYAETGAGISLGLDLFGSAFFELTRYEELVKDERDAHERFPAVASLAFEEGFLRRPIVNEYLEVLWWALRRLWPRLQRKRRVFTDRPSHDVDWPLGQLTTTFTRTLKATGGDVLLRRDGPLAVDRFRSFFARASGNPGPYVNNTFDQIMIQSERHGLRSAFYFIADHTHEDLDGTYSLNDPWIRMLLRRIHDRGHEIGLHPSYRTFRDPAQTHRELQTLVSACEEEGIHQDSWGGRQHFLRWENARTWQNYEDAGLTYDATLGFPDEPAFRCGVCYEYPVFNLETRRPLALRERPLVVMEMSVLDRPPVRVDAAAAEIAELRERCVRFGGDFTLLWHDRRLVSRRERRVYEATLASTYIASMDIPAPNARIVRSPIDRQE